MLRGGDRSCNRFCCDLQRCTAMRSSSAQQSRNKIRAVHSSKGTAITSRLHKSTHVDHASLSHFTIVCVPNPVWCLPPQMASMVPTMPHNRVRSGQ